MSDIQNGFVHRRLPDGGFKVRMIIIIIFLHLSDQEKNCNQSSHNSTTETLVLYVPTTK